MKGSIRNSFILLEGNWPKELPLTHHLPTLPAGNLPFQTWACGTHPNHNIPPSFPQLMSTLQCQILPFYSQWALTLNSRVALKSKYRVSDLRWTQLWIIINERPTHMFLSTSSFLEHTSQGWARPKQEPETPFGFPTWMTGTIKCYLPGYNLQGSEGDLPIGDELNQMAA